MTALREANIEELKFGDLIVVRWLDASRDVSQLPTDDEVVATIYSWGTFLGIRGRKHKHLLLGQSKPPMHATWEADRIPVQLIEQIFIHSRGFLQRFLPRACLRTKKIRLTSSRKNWRIVTVR